MDGHAHHNMGDSHAHHMMHTAEPVTPEPSNVHDMHAAHSVGGHGDGLLQGGVDEVLLFQGAVTSSPATLALACFVLMVCAVLLDYVRLLAWWLETRYSKFTKARLTEETKLKACTNGLQYDKEGEGAGTFSFYHWIILGLLHTGCYIAGTFLMLITMTFNVYIILSIGVGVAIGKLSTMYTKAKLLQ